MAAGDLTTLSDVKAWMTQDQTVTFDDALLTRLITAASGWIIAWLSRPIVQATYTEYRNGNGQCSLAMKNQPITAVSSVGIDGIAVTLAPPTTPSQPMVPGFLFDDRVVYLRGAQFTKGTQNVVITYTAGFAIIPPEIAQACIELVTLRYKVRGREGQASKNIGNGQVVAFKISDMEPSTATLLNQYRTGVPVW